jgi:O-antigen/teichoic acid export membrane protein
MKKLFEYLFKDDFIKKSLFFFIATGSISFINYVYHPILGNLLPVAMFGEIETLFSLYNVFGIFLFAFTSVVIHVTANTPDESERNEFLATIGKTGISFSFIISFLGATLSPILKNIFHFSSATPFIVFASLLPFATYVFFGTAFFQGQKKVRPYAFTHALVSILKLILAVVTIFVGARVVGVMSAFLIAQIVGALYVSRVLKMKMQVFQKGSKLLPEERKKLSREIKYGAMIFVANFSVILFCNGDILTVKYFFSPETAGFYSGVSAIGNIVYFATAPIAAMLLASVKLKNTKKENERVLYLALVACLAFVGAAVLIFNFWHSIIITLLLGSKFNEFTSLLRPISWIMALAALYNILLMYFLALRKKIVFLPAVASFLILLVLVIVRHETVLEVVYNFIIAIIAGMIISVALLLFDPGTKHHEHGI